MNRKLPLLVASAVILTAMLHSATASPEVLVRVGAGDWIKYDWTYSEDHPVPVSDRVDWGKYEFLDVTGTTVTIRLTYHYQDGRETNITETGDLFSPPSYWIGTVLSPNSKIGDLVYNSLAGVELTIQDEETRTYAGVSRTVTYANLSQNGGVHAYWDKQTGLWVEYIVIESTFTFTMKATETNIWTPPSISILFPENKTYSVNNVSLTFGVNESTSWIGYSLDGQTNVTIADNTTLSELSVGPHSLIVYAEDVAGNTGASDTIYFTIKTLPPPPVSFPTSEWVVIAIVVAAIAAVTGFVLYRKRKQNQIAR